MNTYIIKIKIVKFIYWKIAWRLPSSTSSRTNRPKKLRAWCARFLFDSCGQNINIESHVTFWNNCSIGDNSGIGECSEIGGGTHIGKDVMIGRELQTITRNHKTYNCDVPMIKQGFEDFEPIVIDDDVWIGNRVTILPGVHVYSHSVIGAGAVVTKDVPEYAVVAGVPAKVIKYRNCR